MSLWRWAQWITPVEPQFQITLGEGDTPLVRSRRIGPAAGFENLYFKLEMTNPSGSYKDRFAAAAVSHMLANGKRRCVATSSGNTGASLAAYCAAAGIECEIAVVETAPLGKLQQMMAYGADIYRITGFGLDPEVTAKAFDYLNKIASQPDADLQISSFHYSQPGMTGVRSISHELHQQHEQGIDHVFCPAGGGGLTLAVAQGFQQLVDVGELSTSPKVHCVQPTGNNTLAGPLREGAKQGQDVTCTSKISGLQVATVVDGHNIIAATRASGGTGYLVEDEQTWQVQKLLAREEGIFSEPAGAVALTGALQALHRGEIDPRQTVVCLVTGSGFKDPDSLERLNIDKDCPLIPLDELAARGGK